jgi:NAD(P)-dependent dehydrogenase (short-subunit alcohol dehydrogenase family)
LCLAAGKTLEGELQKQGAKALFVHADIRRDADVKALIDRRVSRFGRIDVAVNVAGTEGQPGLIVNQTAGSYAEPRRRIC